MGYRRGLPERSTAIQSGPTELALPNKISSWSRSLPAREPIRGTIFERGFGDRRSASLSAFFVAESPGSAAADGPSGLSGNLVFNCPTKGDLPWPNSSTQPSTHMPFSESEIPLPDNRSSTEQGLVSPSRHPLHSSLTLPSRRLSAHSSAFPPRPRQGTRSYEGLGFGDDLELNSWFPRYTNSENRSTKKALNVESAPFTPAASQQPAKKTFSSSHAASAAVFTPRASAATPSVTPHQPEVEIPSVTTTPSAFSNVGSIREFTPQNYDIGTNGVATVQDAGLNYDPFTMGPVTNSLPTPQYNPYANDHSGLVNHGGAFYPGGQPGFTAPLQPQYHLYAPVGPYKDDLQPWQRSTYDFFMPEKLREDIQKKSHAALQVMPLATQLPQVANYHSLVPLDKIARKTSGIFSYTSWVYKAISSKTGRMYCLRRLEGFKVSNENILRPVKEWKKISNGNIVTLHDAFTNRAFGDSSLMFAQDYHPLSETLAEHHFPSAQKGQFRNPIPATESILWSYIVQISNALRAIHSANLAARCVDLSKIILTDKNRIRLSACGILDVVNYENPKPLAELQQEDFVAFGKVIVSLATHTLPISLNLATAVEQLGRNHSMALKETVLWLLNPPQPGASKSVDNLLTGINHHLATAFDQQQRQSDALYSELYREVENGRAARLMMKLGVINERLEFEGDPRWSENGDRYMIKLFRDFVFHQVDAQGQPVLDMGHMLRCLAKLDAGVDERIRLTSRDSDTDFIVSYKDLGRAINSAFSDLAKVRSQGHPPHQPHRERY